MRLHPSLIPLMQQGLQARREGRSAAAQAVFLQVLRAQPEQPDALALLADSDHPLLGRKFGSWRFSDSWSSRLRSSGFHTQHVHPHGRIRSCYCVDLAG